MLTKAMWKFIVTSLYMTKHSKVSEADKKMAAMLIDHINLMVQANGGWGDEQKQ